MTIKSIIFSVAGIVIASFIGLIVIGMNVEPQNKPNATPIPTEQQSSAENADSGTKATESLSIYPSLTPGIPASTPETVDSGQSTADTVLVTRVIDGDTVELETGQHVRYIGIDTPETVSPTKGVECFGKEASNKNKALVEGKRVRLVKDVSETDRYGRLLRYIYVGDTFISDVLVRQGYAYASTYPPDVKYADQFRQAQQEAQANKAGLWSSCPAKGSQASATAAATPTPTTAVSTGGSCTIKGNISSTGEKIYHVPGCASYNKTVINESAGERYFCSESEAVAAGWRKAKNCP